MHKNHSTPAVEFSPDELVALARLDISRERIEEALYKLKTALNFENPPEAVFTLLARTYAQIGLFDLADDMYRKYLDISPQAVTEKFQLGLTLFERSRLEEALGIWSEILAENGSHPPALFYSALAYALKGEVARAMELLEFLLKNIPADNLYISKANNLLQELKKESRIASTKDRIDRSVYGNPEVNH